MSPNRANTRIVPALAALLGTLVLAVGCGSDDDADTVDPGSASSESAITLEQARAKVDGTPELALLRRQANEILDGGVSDFGARIEELKGTPIVVNKWASWCGPCREEFPYFQSQAIEREDVAFVGILSNDGPDTGASFLEQLPLPYPSYLDSDIKIADSLDIGREFPATVFIDRSGEVTHTKLGPYTSEEDLAADIERYSS